MKKILMIAGGGGHTGHAYTVSQYLAGKAELSYIVPRGDKYSILKLGRFGKIYQVVKPVEPTGSYMGSMHRFIQALADSLKTPIRRADIVVCYGSNHCIAPSILAWLYGKTLCLVESPVRIATPSKTIRLLSLIADYVFVSWREQARFYRNTIVVGPIYEKPIYKPWDGDYILVVTGTYGFPELIEELIRLPLGKSVVQTGRDNPEKYRSQRPDWVFFDYDPDLAKWIAGAKLVITHFGRTAIDAALAYHKPVVMVPNPRWVHGATTQDALLLSRRINAVLLPLGKIHLLPRIIWLARRHRLNPPRYINGALIISRIIERI